MIRTRSFTNDESSVREARSFVLGLLGGLPRELRDSVEVMVSELATNAQLHAGTEFEVGVDLDTSRCLRVTVTDKGRGRPRIKRPGVAEPHGRGLQLVSAMSDSWGTDWAPGARAKTVWFELDLSGLDVSYGDDTSTTLGSAGPGAPPGSPRRTRPPGPGRRGSQPCLFAVGGSRVW